MADILINKAGLFFSRLSFRKILRRSGYAACILLLPIIVIFIVPVLQELIIPGVNTSSTQPTGEALKILDKQKMNLERSILELERKIINLNSRSAYLVINTTENKFYLYKSRKLCRQGECSTGSYVLLESEHQQKWMFKTPKGKFRIQGKTTRPVWKKPDWAFVELGMPVPPENHNSRFEYGVLGDYALSLGHGYLIHGTLYTRFLGLPVTHGCVRINDDDLEAIHNMLLVGSRVYIY